MISIMVKAISISFHEKLGLRLAHQAQWVLSEDQTLCES